MCAPGTAFSLRASAAAAFAFRDQHDLLRPAVDHGAVGNGDDGLMVDADPEHHVGIHVGLEAAVRVGKLEPYPRRARLRLQVGIDEGDGAFDRLLRISAQGHVGPGSERDRRQIRLRNLRDQPHRGQIDDPVQLLARHHTLSVDDFFVDHRPGDWRWPIERARIDALGADLLNSALGHG